MAKRTCLWLKNLPQSQKESTLIHEIIHICNTEVGSENHHALISSLAEQLYQVLKDNKLLSPNPKEK